MKFLTIFPSCPICQNAIVELPSKKALGCPCNRFYALRCLRGKNKLFNLVLDRQMEESVSLRYHYVFHNHQMNILLIHNRVAVEDKFFSTVSNNLAFSLFQNPPRLFSYFRPYETQPYIQKKKLPTSPDGYSGILSDEETSLPGHGIP